MIKNMFGTLLAVLALIGAAATVTGCNTIEGAGKDIKRAGSEIEAEAHEHK